jgi:hypothetical protein
MVAAKVKSGWWGQVHEGVYKTYTGQLARDGLLWAAVLHAGRGAYLSHGTAAELNRLTADAPSVIDVTIPATGPSSHLKASLSTDRRISQ